MNSEVVVPLDYQDFVVAFYREKRGGDVTLKEASSYLREEVEELYDELFFDNYGSLLGDETDKAHLAKELADVLFTAYGVAIAAGINLDKAFQIVAEDNMRNKVKTPDGKVQKKEGYEPPSMLEALL